MAWQNINKCMTGLTDGWSDGLFRISFEYFSGYPSIHFRLVPFPPRGLCSTPFARRVLRQAQHERTTV